MKMYVGVTDYDWFQKDFGNGREYYSHHGNKLLVLPKRRDQLPDPSYLEWHNQNVYVG